MITDLLFYAPSVGLGEFYTTYLGGVNLLRQRTGWSRTWTQIIPGNFGGGRSADIFDRGRFTDLLFYQASTGRGRFYSTDGLGGTSSLQDHTNWRKSWTQIIPGNFGGSGLTDLLFYDASARMGEFYTVVGPGEIKLLNRQTGWRRSWTHIVPGNFGGSGFTDLLFYDASVGKSQFYTTNGEGSIKLLREDTGWRKTWTHIIPGNFGGTDFTDLLFYEPSTGTGVFYTTAEGHITLLREQTGWRKTWTHIIPGNFGGSGLTDLLFYDATAGKSQFYATEHGSINLLSEHPGWRKGLTQIVPGLYAPLQAVRLHLKLLKDPRTPIAKQLAEMREVYLTAGIRVIVRSIESLDLPHLLDAEIGACGTGFGDNIRADTAELFGHRRNVRDNELAIYFIRSTCPSFGGCANYPNDKPGVIMTDLNVSWTLAHEVGHVLGLGHASDKDMLMYDGGDPYSHPPPNLRPFEKQAMFNSTYSIDL